MSGENPVSRAFSLVYKFSSPRSASGILPTAHPVAEEAWFEAEGLRSHQTMAFCCKQRQGRLPGAPSLPLAFCVSLLPHTPVILLVLSVSLLPGLWTASSLLPHMPQVPSVCQTDPHWLSLLFVCISPQTYQTKRSV